MAISHVKTQGSSNWTGTVTLFNSNGSTLTGAASNLVQPGDWNSVHNEFYTLSGNTNNASTVSGSNIVFAGSGNVYMSGSSNSIVVNTPMQSYYENWPLVGDLSQTMTFGNSTSCIQPFELPYALSASYVRFPVSISLQSTTMTAAANTTQSASINSTFDIRVFSQNVGASSLSLAMLASSTAGVTQSWAIGAGAASNNWTVSYGISYPLTGGTSAFSTSTAVTSGTFNLSTNSLTAFTGLMGIDVPFATSLAEGNYWLMFGASSSTAGNATLSKVAMSFSNFAVSQQNAQIGIMGQGASSQMRFGLGSFSTANGATTASVPIANVSSYASNIFPIFQMYRIN